MLIKLLLAASLGFLPMASLQGQDVTYSHPLDDFSFEASPSWDQMLHNYNGKVYEVIHPNHNMKISMSFVPGRKSARKQVKEISGLKGMVCSKKPYDTTLNHKKAVLLQGFCLEGKEPFKRLIIGIPGSDGLYLMEICCPVECYINHRTKVDAILSSLKVEA